MNLALKLIVTTTDGVPITPERAALTPRFEACEDADPGDAAFAKAFAGCLMVRPSYGDLGLAIAVLFAGFYCDFEDPGVPDSGLCLFLGGRMVGTIYLPDHSETFCMNNVRVEQFFTEACSAVVLGPVFAPAMPTIKALTDADLKRRMDILEAHFFQDLDAEFPSPPEHVAASLAAQSSPVTSILRELLLPHTKPKRKMSDPLFIAVGILCTVAVIAVIVYAAVYNSR